MVDCQAMGGLVSFITVSGGWDCLFFFDRNMDIVEHDLFHTLDLFFLILYIHYQ